MPGMSSESPRRREIKRLFALREKQGLTFDELSDHSGIPVGTLRWWSHRLRCGESDTAAFVDLGVIDADAGLTGSESSPDARLLHPSGLVIELHGEFADQIVSSLLHDVLPWS